MKQHKSIRDRNVDANKVPQGSKEVIYFQVIILTVGNIYHILSFQDVLPAHSTNSRIGAPRRRFVEDEEAYGHGDSVVGIKDVKPDDPVVVLSDSAQLPTANGLGKRGLKRRRIVSDDEEEGQSADVSREDEKKVKRKRVKEEEPIRYFVFLFLIFVILSIFLFLQFINQSKKTNPRSQVELPHVPQCLVIAHRFRQSVSWDPSPRKPFATLHSKVHKRNEVL